jgi:hypothetical protein
MPLRALPPPTRILSLLKFVGLSWRLPSESTCSFRLYPTFTTAPEVKFSSCRSLLPALALLAGIQSLHPAGIAHGAQQTEQPDESACLHDAPGGQIRFQDPAGDRQQARLGPSHGHPPYQDAYRICPLRRRRFPRGAHPLSSLLQGFRVEA